MEHVFGGFLGRIKNMDIIQRAKEKKLHISENENLNVQTWQLFEKCAADKKIFLFGVGMGADYFFENYGDITLEGVIDNDIQKQGFRVDDFAWGARNSEYGKLTIASIELLDQYDLDQVVVLITSTNYYKQIIEKLETFGIKNTFVLLMMEVNKRNELGYVETENKTETKGDHIDFCCREKVEWNKIIFYSFGTYSDHGKYITEALLKIRNDLDIVWAVSDMKTEVPERVRKVWLGNRKRFIYEMETAKVWIYNMPVPQYIIKRQGQIYIQTKHWASITLKKFYLDAITITDVTKDVAWWKQDSRKMDYIITGSDFDTQSCRRGFDFHKEVLQVGSPRSDAMFLQKEKKEKVYKYYDLCLEKHMLLYAPTYRYNRNRLAQETPIQEIREVNLDYKGVKAALEKHFGGEWYIALRLHPGHEKTVGKLEIPEYVINLSAYEDGEETAAACDVMISDYSSIMFEPAFVNKPVFLFATDKKEYIDKEYNLLIDYDTLPFPIAESNKELIENINDFAVDDYERKLDFFMKEYGIHEDGHASERAASIISNFFNDKKEKGK